MAQQTFSRWQRQRTRRAWDDLDALIPRWVRVVAILTGVALAAWRCFGGVSR